MSTFNVYNDVFMAEEVSSFFPPLGKLSPCDCNHTNDQKPKRTQPKLFSHGEPWGRDPLKSKLPQCKKYSAYFRQLQIAFIVKTTLKLINTEGEVKRTNELSITGALALAPKVGTFIFTCYQFLLSQVLAKIIACGIVEFDFFPPGGEFLQFDQLFNASLSPLLSSIYSRIAKYQIQLKISR